MKDNEMSENKIAGLISDAVTLRAMQLPNDTRVLMGPIGVIVTAYAQANGVSELYVWKVLGKEVADRFARGVKTATSRNFPNHRTWSEVAADVKMNRSTLHRRYGGAK